MGKTCMYHRDGHIEAFTAEEALELNANNPDWADTPTAFEEGGPKYQEPVPEPDPTEPDPVPEPDPKPSRRRKPKSDEPQREDGANS